MSVTPFIEWSASLASIIERDEQCLRALEPPWYPLPKPFRRR